MVKSNSFLSFLILFLSTISASNLANAQSLEHYKLGADDVISVSVFDEPDLSLKEARVSSTGTIAMPLIGQVDVKGLSVSEAEQLIRELYLGDYLKKPDINITIVEYRQFYVNGEVNKPGGYSFRDGMTIQRAITLAGGFTERAARKNIKLLRENGNGVPVEADISTQVRPGDVITVEESFF
ncbi:polysaccharide biosynthesis/export family protein [Alteromonas sp. C1M14]|uniref:polysaccharide biosynthesis/export family protein n=1 Tax=Alteromonas sp. C1M14 TaxID=2841567 RepID=UPI001C09775A|nr:polysaccharide biosynthesis/export family protein [Alteromonas sp. C1M14]MBU2979939.1 polysaccharide export protein [Alteromonas sp. C1M14]